MTYVAAVAVVIVLCGLLGWLAQLFFAHARAVLTRLDLEAERRVQMLRAEIPAPIVPAPRPIAAGPEARVASLPPSAPAAPPAGAKPQRTKPQERLCAMLRERDSLALAFLLREVLDKPVSQRPGRGA